MLSVVCVEAAEVGKQLAKVGGCGSGQKRQRTGQCVERELRLEETGIKSRVATSETSCRSVDIQERLHATEHSLQHAIPMSILGNALAREKAYVICPKSSLLTTRQLNKHSRHKSVLKLCKPLAPNSTPKRLPKPSIMSDHQHHHILSCRVLWQQNCP